MRQRTVPFGAPGSLTRVIGVASGKGGVGKSSLTVNLACAMAADGLRVGIIDADVLGFSVPGLMGITQAPTRVDEMILPPVAYGVKVISIGMFVKDNQPVIWRGPMLHRALEQFLTDVHFGDLDVLLLDLPPGTGDMAISMSQLLPDRAAGGHHPAVGRRRGGGAGRFGGHADRAEGPRRRGEHVLARTARRHPDGAVRLRRRGALAARLSEILGASVPLLGRLPLEPGCARAGTTACRSCFRPGTPAAAALRPSPARWPPGRAAWPG